jgi:hypothetical protein
MAASEATSHMTTPEAWSTQLPPSGAVPPTTCTVTVVGPGEVHTKRVLGTIELMNSPLVAVHV